MNTAWVPCGYILIAGPANAGKSSLFNAMTKHGFSSVDTRPFTTRHPLTGLREISGARACFIDTPALEKGIEGDLLSLCDAVVLVLNARSVEGDLLLPCVKELIQNTEDKPLLIALGHGDHIPETLRAPLALQTSIRVSALGVFTVSPPLREGVDPLLAAVVKLLPVREQLFPKGVASLNSGRFLASEQIRTVVYRILSEDISETTAVQVEEYTHRNGKLYIRVNLHVSKLSDKGTVIGRKGQTLSRIQQESTSVLERSTGIPVQLEAWVKAREGWPDNPRDLMEFGYAL